MPRSSSPSPLAQWLNRSEISPHTTRAYRAETQRFAEFLKTRGRSVATLDAPTLRAFWRDSERSLTGDRQRAAGSVTQTRRIVGAFVRWCVDHRYAPVGALAAIREAAHRATRSKREPQLREAPPASRQLKRLLTRAPSTRGEAAVVMGFWVGASPQEVARVRASDLNAASGMLTVRSRDSSAHEVPLPRPIARALHKLLRASPAGSASPAAVAQRVRRQLKAEPANARSARSLRHLFVALARRAGWTTEELQAHLRRPNLRLSSLATSDHRSLAAIDALLKSPRA